MQAGVTKKIPFAGQEKRKECDAPPSHWLGRLSHCIPVDQRVEQRMLDPTSLLQETKQERNRWEMNIHGLSVSSASSKVHARRHSV